MKLLTNLALVAAALSFNAAADYGYSIHNGLVELTNGSNMKVSVAPQHGGELSGIEVKHQNQWHQLIYRANDFAAKSGWRGKAPLLWPATGGILYPNDQPITAQGNYPLNGKKYPMKFHGFARDHAWQIDEAGSNKQQSWVKLRFIEQPQNQKYYPFNYDFSVTYVLKDQKLSLNYQIDAAADNQTEMPFSIGNHITFKAPLIKGSSLNKTMFEISSTKNWLKDSNNYPTGEIIESPYQGKLPLNKMPNLIPVSYSHSPAKPEFTVFDPSGLTMNLSHSASSMPKNMFIDFNFWNDFTTGFFCPEPWIGAQNALNNQMGLIKLPAGKSWNWNVEIEFGLK